MLEHKLFKIQTLDAKTLTWWNSKREKIDFEPSYQRKGRRWSTSDKQYLIDSILNGFDIPKFYVADFTWGTSRLNEQKKSFAVIDGKQRFEAIFDFFADKFALSSTFSLLSDPSLDLRGKRFSELKDFYPDVAEVFENFNPFIVGVITDDKAFVEELFVRLNRSKPLSGAEIRNAISSPISEMIRIIGTHPFFTSNVKFDTNKGQNLNCAVKLLIFESLGTVQETKKSTLDKFVVGNNYDHVKAEKALPILLETLDSLAETFQFKDPLLNSEGPVPVYYWLARNSNDNDFPYIRDFLESFQAELKSAAYKKSKFISLNDWQNYKTASRSINDKSSHDVRYKILSASFKLWITVNI